METIIAALITGVFGAVGVIASIIAARQRDRARDAESDVMELQNAITDTSKDERQGYLRRYGFKAASVTDIRTITDLQGTVQMEREYKGVKVVAEGISLGYLPGRAWVSRPGTIQRQPWLVARPDFPRLVDLRIESYSSQECVFRLEIAGGLMEGDPALNYTLRTTYRGGVVMTKEETEDAYRDDVFKNEYMSFDVDFPLDELELRVEFPEHYKVQCYPAVFLGHSECMHQLQLEQTTSGFEATSTGGARFRVKEPLLGFGYAIYWIPPPQKEVDRLRVEA